MKDRICGYNEGMAVFVHGLGRGKRHEALLGGWLPDQQGGEAAHHFQCGQAHGCTPARTCNLLIS